MAAFTASVTWAFASVRYAEAARVAGPVPVNLLRALSASLLWFCALGVAQGWTALADVGAHEALLLAGSIACSYALGDSLFFAAASRIGVPAAMAIATIYPLWAALYGALARGEGLGHWRVLGLLACLAGVSALLRLSRASANDPGTRRAGLWGVGLALITSLCWAGNAVFLKLGAQELSVYQANTVRFAWGTLLLLAQLPLRRRAVAAPEQRLTPLARRLSLALLVDTGLGSVCFVYGIAHTDLALGTTLSSLSPLVALPVAAALGTERVTWARALAVTLTVAGVVLLVLAPGR